MTRRQVARVVHNRWSGPLPPPEILSGYEDVYPGAAKIVIDQMVVQGEHRRRIERVKVATDAKDIRADRVERRLGQKLAGAIAALAIISGSTVAVLGHEKTGVAIGSGITVGLVTVFITGRATANGDRFSTIRSGGGRKARRSDASMPVDGSPAETGARNG